MAPRAALGELEGVPNAALHAVAGVDRALRGNFERRAAPERAAFARIGALRVLAHDDEVGVRGDRAGTPLKGRRLMYRSSSKRSLSSNPRSITSRWHRGRADRRTDGAEQDGFGASKLARTDSGSTSPVRA